MPFLSLTSTLSFEPRFVSYVHHSQLTHKKQTLSILELLVKISSGLKSNKSLKLLLLANMKAISRIGIRWEMTGMIRNKQKCPIFNEIPQVRGQNQIRNKESEIMVIIN